MCKRWCLSETFLTLVNIHQKASHDVLLPEYRGGGRCDPDHAEEETFTAAAAENCQESFPPHRVRVRDYRSCKLKYTTLAPRTNSAWRATAATHLEATHIYYIARKDITHSPWHILLLFFAALEAHTQATTQRKNCYVVCVVALLPYSSVPQGFMQSRCSQLLLYSIHQHPVWVVHSPWLHFKGTLSKSEGEPKVI